MDFIQQMIDRLSLDNTFVQAALLLIALVYAGRQFLIWQRDGSNKNRRRSKQLVNSEDYIKGASTTQRIKAATINIENNEQEKLVKLSDQVSNQDGKIHQLQNELDIRLETIQALEKDIEHWHKDWSGLEEELKKKDQKLVEMESLLGDQAETVPQQSATPPPILKPSASQEETDNLGDYISTWIQKTNEGSPFDAYRASNDANMPKPAKPAPAPKSATEKPHNETQPLLDASELLGDADNSEAEFNEQLHYQHTIADLQATLLDKQRTIDELKVTSNNKEVLSLKEQLAANEVAFQRLQAEAAKLQPLQGELSNKEKEVAALKSELQSHTETTTHLEQHVDDWQGRYQALEQQFVEQADKLEQTEKEAEAKTSQLKTLEDAAAQVTELQSKLYELESNQQKLQTEVELSKQEADQLRSQLSTKDQALEAAQAKPKVDWQARYTTLNEQFSEHKQLATTLTEKLEADLDKLKAQQAEANEQAGGEWKEKYLALKAESRSTDNEKAQLQSELEKKQQSLAALEEELQSVWDRWNEMEASLKKHDGERDDLQNNLLEKEAAITDLENRLLAQRTEYETATTRLKDNDDRAEEIKTLKQKLDELSEENKTLSAQMQEADSELQQTITSEGNQKLKVSELQELIRQREDKIGIIQTELNEKSSAFQALNMQLAAKDQQTSQLEKIVEQKNQELENLRTQNSASSEEEQGIKLELSEIHQRLEEANETLKQKELTIENLTDKLTSSNNKLEAIEDMGDDESHTVTQIISTLSATAGVNSKTEDWQEGVQEINQALKDSNQEVEKLKKQLEKMHEFEMTANMQDEALLALKKEIKSRDDNIKKMKSELNNWESQWNQFTDTMVVESDKLEKQSESIDSLKAKMKSLDASEASEKIRDAAVDTLKRDIEAASSSVKELEQSLESMNPEGGKGKAPKLTRVIKRGTKKKWFSK